MRAAERERAIDVLDAKGAVLPCPRCGKFDFDLLGNGGHVMSSVRAGGRCEMIPVVVLACSQCGYIIQHARGPLGI